MAKKTQKDMVQAPAEELEVLDQAEEPAEEAKVEFEEWYALREAQIPAFHKKEIIMADFKGRKVSMKETVQVFDEALKQYGVKLK